MHKWNLFFKCKIEKENETLNILVDICFSKAEHLTPL